MLCFVQEKIFNLVWLGNYVNILAEIGILKQNKMAVWSTVFAKCNPVVGIFQCKHTHKKKTY